MFNSGPPEAASEGNRIYPVAMAALHIAEEVPLDIAEEVPLDIAEEVPLDIADEVRSSRMVLAGLV